MHRVRLGRLLLAGVLMIGGCGEYETADQPEQIGATGEWRTPGCEFSREPEFSERGGLRMPLTPAPLRDAMERIEQAGRHRFPDSFAGLEVDQYRVRAIVYRVPRLSTEFDDFIRQTAANTCIVVRDAAHAVAELTTWHDRVAADLAFWQVRGVRIVTIGSRHDGAGVEVGVREVAKARADMPAYYGADAPLIFVEQGPATPFTDGWVVLPEHDD
ncbi:hypothetical protein ACWT_7701 [Actinoplanes sp. SE50]|uniref:hypothetical protein n=1 Tax=unclassified Actinoplanes TaxID=2626549 RepID=UPI00023EDE5B|nr:MULTISPECIES: hypothetical protein [unclassified Actinoplanes]AEV88712.1 hypothetical protein ACPL_7832 [Actinoplanes sp. SE50/110]ATO87116.1 hypothetical protein ACWT_7701 [Actinoplanes sp. SE50]SLM04534.1 uncharacterized protein ACSP50_7841 [Actinoplanes sp. SE50/110]